MVTAYLQGWWTVTYITESLFVQFSLCTESNTFHSSAYYLNVGDYIFADFLEPWSVIFFLVLHTH